jgi:predicted N-acetyltransferase YhbS
VTDPVLRRAARQDTPGICALLRRAFPDNAKGRPEILDWQYWNNPFGPPTVLVWEDAGRIVGHYAVVTYPAVIAGRAGQLGIGIDAAVDPDYQGRQLFGPLARELYRQAAADGHDVVICYPNDNSVRGIARQGWEELGLLRTRILPLRPGWYARRTGAPAPLLAPAVAALRLRARRGTNGHQTREIDGPPADADALWALAGRGTANGVVRDHAWLRWRYADRPGPSPYRWFEARRDGHLHAIAVTTEQQQHGGTFGYLLELIATDGVAARAAVAHTAAASPACDGLLLATLPGTPPARLAAVAGLLPVPSRLEEKQLHFGAVDPSSDQRTGWSLGWGDLDHL